LSIDRPGGARHDLRVVPPLKREASDRASGLVLAAALAVLAATPLVSGQPPRLSLGAGALAVLLVALARPGLLAPLHRALRWGGRAVGFCVQQIVLGVLFFLVVTPMGWVARLSGRDVLGARFRSGVDSYFVRREPTQSPADDLRHPY
jgi:hypothetical protein